MLSIIFTGQALIEMIIFIWFILKKLVFNFLNCCFTSVEIALKITNALQSICFQKNYKIYLGLGLGLE